MSRRSFLMTAAALSAAPALALPTVIDMRDHGLGANIDNTAALTSALSAAVSTGVKTIWFPAGQWPFYTRPPTITCGVRLVGQGASNTVLERRYSGNFLMWNGAGGGGGGIEDLFVFSGAGMSTGSAVTLYAQANNFSPDFFSMRNVVISGGGTWDYGLVLWGQDRAMGLRNFHGDNVNVLNCQWAAALLYRAVGARLSGGFYQGGGSTAGIFVDHGSDGVYIHNSFTQGSVQVGNSSNVWVNGTQRQ